MAVRRRALVLAAGAGQRLRPLTLRVPKPLLPVCGTPIITATLEALQRHGVDAVGINLHHLAGAIPAALGQSFGGMRLVYREEQTLLGTLGPLAAFRELLSDCDELFVINGDSRCRWPLEQLSAARRRARARIALLLTSRGDTVALGGGLGVDRRGHLRLVPELDLGGVVRRRVFAGAHCLVPSVLEGLEVIPADSVRQLYRPMIAAGEVIATATTSRHWDDLGTPESYRIGVLRSLVGGSWVAPTARIGARVQLLRSVVEAGVVVEPGVRLEDTVVLPGAHIGAGASVRRAVVGFETTIAPGAELEGGVW